MAVEVDRAVGHLQESVRCDHGGTVEGEVCPSEAGVDKLIFDFAAT